MRLIDAEALRKLLFGRAMANPTATVTIAAEVLDDIFRMVPTISCETCVRDYVDHDQFLAYCADCFCGCNFQRRVR